MILSQLCVLFIARVDGFCHLMVKTLAKAIVDGDIGAAYV